MRRVFIVLAVFISGTLRASSTDANDGSTPGKVLLYSVDTSIPHISLKPQTFKLAASQNLGHKPRQIDGLLWARQSCQAGYDECAGGCCYPGEWCYASAHCCLLSEIGCENKGCAPVGSNCCKGGGYCDAGDYCVISSSGVRGCCPIGEVCYGGGGGGGEPTTAPRPTTHTSTSTEDFTTTDLTSITLPPSPTSITGVASITKTALASVPTPSAGSKNVHVSLNDPTIDWGTGWSTATASCNSTATSKKCSGDSSSSAYLTMSYTFKGSAVYLNLASLNTDYMISINGEEHQFGTSAVSAGANCTFSWSITGLQVTYTNYLYLYINGATTKLMSGRAVEDDSPWWLEVNNIVITQTDDTTSSSEPSSVTATGFRSSSSGVTTVVPGRRSVWNALGGVLLVKLLLLVGCA